MSPVLGGQISGRNVCILMQDYMFPRVVVMICAIVVTHADTDSF